MLSESRARAKAAQFYQQVTRVHLEVTEKCNAACPQCHRNYHGGPTRFHVGKAELSLKDVQRVLPADFVRKLELLYGNGNYGDGAIAKDIFEIFRYFRESSPRLHTML